MVPEHQPQIIPALGQRGCDDDLDLLGMGRGLLRSRRADWLELSVVQRA